MIGVLVIATNKYKEFTTQLTLSICKNFLANHMIRVHLFTDGDCEVYEDHRVKVVTHKIPSYKWPYATLYRYRIFTSVEYDEDYIFYLDVDMNINDTVGDEVLGELVAVRHPGYFHGGWGSESCDPRSQGYVPKEKQGKYYCGGFQGGSVREYYKAMLVMDSMIGEDERNGVMAQWHDETMWNKYLIGKKFKELDCRYCMPQSWSKRVYSKIQDMPAKILALEKDFKEIRA